MQTTDTSVGRIVQLAKRLKDAPYKKKHFANLKNVRTSSRAIEYSHYDRSSGPLITNGTNATLFHGYVTVKWPKHRNSSTEGKHKACMLLIYSKLNKNSPTVSSLPR